MSNAKKFLIIVFTVMLVISLQFNTSLTHKMNNGFTLTQLMENIFVPEAYATKNYCRFLNACMGGPVYCGFNSNGVPCMMD
ncbi:hypothetical protein ACX8XN_06115 [Calditrichota bacterium GD2]